MNIYENVSFQSEIVIEQLELHKPPPSGPPKYRIIILVVGLVIVLLNLSERKIPLLVKIVGPCLVMVGLTAMLVRILFSYTPSICDGGGSKGKTMKRERPSEHALSISQGVTLSHHDLENSRSCDNLRSRQRPKTTSKPSEVEIVIGLPNV